MATFAKKVKRVIMGDKPRVVFVPILNTMLPNQAYMIKIRKVRSLK